MASIQIELYVIKMIRKLDELTLAFRRLGNYNVCLKIRWKSASSILTWGYWQYLLCREKFVFEYFFLQDHGDPKTERRQWALQKCESHVLLFVCLVFETLSFCLPVMKMTTEAKNMSKQKLKNNSTNRSKQTSCQVRSPTFPHFAAHAFPFATKPDSMRCCWPGNDSSILSRELLCWDITMRSSIHQS